MHRGALITPEFESSHGLRESGVGSAGASQAAVLMVFFFLCFLNVKTKTPLVYNYGPLPVISRSNIL